MKKFLSILLSAVMLMSVAACGSNNTESNENVLKVGMECNYAPYNWSQDNDANGAVPIVNVDNM